MPMTCTICKHTQRAEIDKAIVSGESLRNIAQQYEVGYTSVERHSRTHLPQSIQKSQAAKEEAQALDVVAQLRDINKITLDILKEARDKKKNGIALFAIDRVMKQLELQAKLIGAIDTPTVNIYMAPEWQVIRSTLVQSLAPYADARVAVAAALSKLEGKDNARFN